MSAQPLPPYTHNDEAPIERLQTRIRFLQEVLAMAPESFEQTGGTTHASLSAWTFGMTLMLDDINREAIQVWRGAK